MVRRILQLLHRTVLWLLVLILVATLATLIVWAGPEWSEAIVQALAAVGGLAYWGYRTKPRVSLRLHYRGGALYIQLANIGNRTAKRVELHCDPPITLRDERIGPIEQFGDMAAGQRYTLMIGFSDDVKTPQRTTFRLSHDRRFLKRHVETLRLGGSGWTWTLSTDAGTPIYDLADSVRSIDKNLKGLNNLTKTVWSYMRPQATGGEHLPQQECATCGWGHFFYDHNRFICQNCNARFEIVDCTCGDVRWCEHRPTPTQSHRPPTLYQ